MLSIVQPSVARILAWAAAIVNRVADLQSQALRKAPEIAALKLRLGKAEAAVAKLPAATEAFVRADPEYQEFAQAIQDTLVDIGAARQDLAYALSQSVSLVVIGADNPEQVRLLAAAAPPTLHTLDLGDRIDPVSPLTVRPVRGYGIVGIGDREHPRRDRAAAPARRSRAPRSRIRRPACTCIRSGCSPYP